MSITRETVQAANSKVGYVIVGIDGRITNTRVSHSHIGATEALHKCITLGVLSGEPEEYVIKRMTGADYMATTGRFF